MDDQGYRYAEEMMRVRSANHKSSESLEAKMLSLNSALSLTESHCLSLDYCPAVTTQKGGILGKMVVLAKRIARKATFFIVKDLTQEIAGFQKEALNTLAGIIELQEDIVIELINARVSAAARVQDKADVPSEPPKGDLT